MDINTDTIDKLIQVKSVQIENGEWENTLFFNEKQATFKTDFNAEKDKFGLVHEILLPYLTFNASIPDYEWFVEDYYYAEKNGVVIKTDPSDPEVQKDYEEIIVKRYAPALKLFGDYTAAVFYSLFY